MITSSSSPPLYVRACGPINSALCHICTFVRESCTTGINTFGEYLLTATANPVRASRRRCRLHWKLFGWRGKSVFRHPSSANYKGTRQQQRRRRRRRRKEDWRRIVIDLTWAKLSDTHPHPPIHPSSHLLFRRISVIFRVRSAKAVKITDASLLKRLGILCGGE